MRAGTISREPHEDSETIKAGASYRQLKLGAAWLLAGACLVLFMYRPSVSDLVETLPWNLGDPTLSTWILAWESHAAVSEPTRFFDGNIFHPFGEAIKYSEIMLPLVALFGVIYGISGSPMLAHNLVILCLSLFCLATTFLLARRLIGQSVAVVAAASFTFSGYVFMHQTHIHLLTLGLFPMAFVALFRVLERRRVRDGLWLGVCTGLLASASFHYGAIWFVCLVVAFVIDLIRIRRPDHRWVSAFGTAGVVSALIIGPIAYVYAEFRSRIAIGGGGGGPGLDAIDFITPAPGSFLYGPLFDWAVARQPSGYVEHGFFMGFVAMTLAIVGIVRLLRPPRVGKSENLSSTKRYELRLLTFLGVISLLLAVGPEAIGLPMPLRIFIDYVPGFGALRDVTRLAVPALLALAVLSALGVQGLVRSLDTQQRAAVVALILSAVALELWVQPLRAEVEPLAPIHEVVREAPPGAVIELPIRQVADTAFVFAEGPRLLQSVGDWRGRFNGFSGAFPPGYLESIPTLMSFPEAQALEKMSEFDLRYVVLNGSQEASDSTYAFSQIESILAHIPESSVTRAGSAWLVDLNPD